jgi:hypothetical protein
MSEIVNLRRVRKAKVRAAAAAVADANRTKHGVPKRERDLTKAQDAKVQKEIAAHKLDGC